MKLLSIVIPTLNEEQGIAPVLSELPTKELLAMGYESEILVIDNGSTDRTVSLARKYGANVIIQPIRGYGNAYKAGFANASGDIIVTGDADLTYPFSTIPSIIQKMEEQQVDFVNTNRLIGINPQVMTRSHMFGNWVLTRISQFLFGIPFADSQSGMWIFKRFIWDKLNVESSGMAFSQEIKIEAFIRGFRCSEVPIEYRMRAGKEKLNTLHDGAKVFLSLFYKRFSLFSEQIEHTANDVLAID